ncbi:MAG: hypothetical protein J1E81_04440 [Eubacterium sp.]|nr:hypothetical protein [Eubacterium sp.]
MDLNIEEKNIKLIKNIKKYQTQKINPIVIEFDGTPNAGKTTVVEEVYKVLNSIFKCSYIMERAKNCKIKDKLSPKFNFITGTQTIIRIIEEIECNNQIILCERGLLDAIFWMHFHNENKRISNECKQALTQFFLLNDFIKCKFFSLVLQCDSNSAIMREKIKNKYINNKKRIVNEEVIDMYNISIDNCYEQYKNQFSSIKIDTSDMTIQEVFDVSLFHILKYINKQIENDYENLDK